jgi:hypothetical protein
MRECYHKACDEFNNPNITDKNFDFLTAITQALVFSVADLATDGKTRCHLEEYVPLPTEDDLEYADSADAEDPEINLTEQEIEDQEIKDLVEGLELMEEQEDIDNDINDQPEKMQAQQVKDVVSEMKKYLKLEKGNGVRKQEVH